MKKNCHEKQFWDLGLNPIDMLPPSNVLNVNCRKEYYKKNKETYKIRNLTNHLKKQYK